MEYYIVDAFTDQLFGGNPASVVLLGRSDFPDAEAMRRIAAEFRYSETAFVRQNEDGSFSIRYFTPVHEVPLCGHATIATFGVLYHKGIVVEGQNRLIQTLSGPLNAVIGQNVMMQMATPQIVGTIESKMAERLCRLMGLKEKPALPIQIVSTGLPDIMLPIADVETLQNLSPDMAALSRLSEETQTVSVHAFALTDDGITAHVRDFAPAYGIDEESATGTANAALTYYLYHNHLITSPARCTFLQGEAMKRPSKIATTLEVIEKQCDIWVGGPSRIVAKGELYL